MFTKGKGLVTIHDRTRRFVILNDRTPLKGLTATVRAEDMPIKNLPTRFTINFHVINYDTKAPTRQPISAKRTRASPNWVTNAT